MSKNLGFDDEKAPCETCCIAKICREQRAACADYWVFVDRSNAPRTKLRNKSRRHPTREVHEFLFCGLESIDTGRRDGIGRPIYVEPKGFSKRRRIALDSLPVRGGA